MGEQAVWFVPRMLPRRNQRWEFLFDPSLSILPDKDSVYSFPFTTLSLPKLYAALVCHNPLHIPPLGVERRVRLFVLRSIFNASDGFMAAA